MGYALKPVTRPLHSDDLCVCFLYGLLIATSIIYGLCFVQGLVVITGSCLGLRLS